MKTRYQVFISSTYEDLQEQREFVIKALLELGHIPVGMEMFSAGDEQQWELIKRQIDDSDYYVVIIAHRYGTLDGQISYTEKEYDYALEKGVPVLGFVLHDDAQWPASQIENDVDARSSLDKFKQRVKSRMVSFWRTSEDLHAKVSIAIAKAVTAYPRVGWVRSSASVSPELINELSRLSKENAELRGELKKANRKGEQAVQDEESSTINTLKNNKVIVKLRFRGESGFDHPVDSSLYEIFGLIAQEASIEMGVKKMTNYLAFFMRSRAYRDQTVDSNVPIATNQVKALLGNFHALGLLEPSTKRHKVGDPEEYWQITSKGKALHLAQIRRLLERTALQNRQLVEESEIDRQIEQSQLEQEDETFADEG